MLSVGLTGNVASGKSTVATYFASWGATVLDADQLVRDVQSPGTPTHAAIVDAFGVRVRQPDGTLDRGWLRHRILHDDDARSRLNHIVHPAVGARRAYLAAEAVARGDAILVNDIPLLFEVLNPADFDLVVLVDAPAAIRRRRLVELRGLSADDAERLMAAQQPSEAKRARSDIVIDNAGSPADLERAARAAWHTVRTRAAQASDGGRGPLVVVIAHGDDLLATMQGTVERYGDAGIDVCIVSATSAPTVGVGVEVVTLDRAVGDVDPEDADAVDRVTQVLKRMQPSSVVTFGPDGLNQHPDHRAVHAWTRRALDRVTTSARHCYFARHPQIESSRRRPLAFGIDVRPWRSGEDGHVAPGLTSCGLEPRAGWAVADRPGREWYRQAGSGEGSPTGLFDSR